MYLPKKDLYESLQTLGYEVTQTQQTVFNTLPTITFRVTDNSIETDLDNEIAFQDIEVIIDIWADTSVEASRILSEVEELLRSQLWKMTYSADVPNTGNIFHVVSRFRKKV